MRQHHQFGVEIFGDNSSEADAEIILLGLTYLKKLGIKNLRLKLNSIGNKDSRKKFRKEFLDYFSSKKNELPEVDKKKFDVNPIRILDSKEKVTRDLILDSPKPIEFLDDESKQHWEKLQSIINQMIEHFDDIDLVIDHNLVRGLDYYSMTVFEIEPVDKSEKSQASILSGGRYDNLISYIGGPETPAAGFGSGIERVMLSMDNDFFEIDESRFPAFTLVHDVLQNEGLYPNVFNYLNELLVDFFLKGKIKFTDIVDLNRKNMELIFKKNANLEDPSIKDIKNINNWIDKNICIPN